MLNYIQGFQKTLLEIIQAPTLVSLGFPNTCVQLLFLGSGYGAVGFIRRMIGRGAWQLPRSSNVPELNMHPVSCNYNRMPKAI